MLMDLYIETLTGVAFELRVSPAETIMSVKSKIQNSEGIPVTQQHLIWRNDELDDHRRLRDYAISGGSTLRLVLGLRGGPLNAHRVPPLRLTPIQFNPSTSSLLSQLNRSFTFRGRPTRLPRTNISSNSKQQQEQSGNPQTLTNKELLPVDRIPTDGEERLSNNPACAPFSGGLAYDPGLSVKSGNALVEESTQVALDVGNELGSDIRQIPLSPNLISNLDSLSIRNSDEIVAPEPGSQTNASTTDEHASTSPEPPLGYPPLIKSSGIIRPPLTCDLSSYCRMYEPHRITAYPKSFVIRNSFPVFGAAESDSDSSPPGTASDRDSPRFDSRSGSDANLGDDDYQILGSSANAAALLAGFLPGPPSEQVGFACQTSGSERVFGSSQYPYHWLKRRASPFSQGPSDGLTSNGPVWEPDEMCADALLNSFLDFHGDSDGELDENGDDSVQVRASHITQVMDDDDDDDSLTDLDDYLLYYRTGDLLFGPPSLALNYPSYSYLTVRDPHMLDVKRTADNEQTSASDPNLQASSGSIWKAECAQMVEKVTNLKNRMKELRIRRQNRQNARGQAPTADEMASGGSCLKGDHENFSLSKKEFSDSLQPPNHATNSTHSSEQRNSTITPESHEKPHRRRLGTIVSPDLNSLLPSPAPNPSTSTVTDPSLSSSSRDPFQRSNMHLPWPSLDKTVSARISTHPLSSHSYRLPAAAMNSSTSSVQLAEISSCEVPNSCLPSKPRMTVASCRPSTSVTSKSSSDINGSIPILNPMKRLQSADTVRSRLHLVDSTQTMLKPIDLFKLPKIKSSSQPLKLDDTLSRQSPPKSSAGINHQPTLNLVSRRRCALCLRKTGIVNSYLCRCGKNFCTRHRYAESHACSFDYKADGRRTLIESNPIVAAPKLPKI